MLGVNKAYGQDLEPAPGVEGWGTAFCSSPVDIFTIFTQPTREAAMQTGEEYVEAGLCTQFPSSIPITFKQIVIEDFFAYNDLDVRASVWEVEQNVLVPSIQYVVTSHKEKESY